MQNDENNGWKTVSFGKGKKKEINTLTTNTSIHDPDTGINMNIFYAGTGKYLTSQRFTYKNKNPLIYASNTPPNLTTPAGNHNGNMKTKTTLPSYKKQTRFWEKQLIIPIICMIKKLFIKF